MSEGRSFLQILRERAASTAEHPAYQIVGEDGSVGLTWDDVVAPEIGAHAAEALVAARLVGTGSGSGAGSGPFGYRRDRELSPHEQFFMVLLSPRTPADVKRQLRSLEARVLDGEITPQETQNLRSMYQDYVVG